MDAEELLARRLASHGLGERTFSSAPATVAALGAVQSQDFGGALWAVAQRTQSTTRSDLLDAFNRGEILRTHVLRPTWHFVAASDLEWMVELTGPRIERAISSNYRKFGLDARVFVKTDEAVAEALSGGNHLTRSELGEAFLRVGIDVAEPVRLTHILIHAEAVGLICSGAQRGASPTWALVQDRIPAAGRARPDDAAVELAERYFWSHGPATARDLSWWSGMTLRECEAAIARSGIALSSRSLEGETYWCSSAERTDSRLDDDARLLPNYDEYLVGYADRSALFDATYRSQLDSRRNPLFNNTVILSGRVSGTWKRTSRRGETTAHVELFEAPSRRTRESVDRAIEGFAAWASPL